MSRPARFLLAALAALVALALLRPLRPTDAGIRVSSRTDEHCRVKTGTIMVPKRSRAVHFKVAASSPGRPCSKEVEAVRLEGFSIRTKDRTVFVLYVDADRRTVSDPVPLSVLALPPGNYKLLAAPASGAAVTLSYELEEPPSG